MDNGSVDLDWKLLKELAEALGYEYNPYLENRYVREAINIIKEKNGRSLHRKDRPRFG